eukprot:14415758-Ditylum_brightwellii.AAC.1
MNQKQVGIWGWAETNINWTKKATGSARALGKNIFKNMKIFPSSSDEPAAYCQQDGPCQDITNKNKGTIMKGRDNPMELRRWIFVQLAGKDKRKIVVITAY